MIRQESWYKESANLDRQLQELKRRVKSNDLGAVTELTILLQRVSPGSPTLYENFMSLFEEAHPGGSRRNLYDLLTRVKTYHKFLDPSKRSSLRIELRKLIEYLETAIREISNLYTASWDLYTGELKFTILIPNTWERAEEYSKKAVDLWGDIFSKYGGIFDRADKGLEYRYEWNRE